MISRQVAKNGSPLILTIRSPGRSPACHSGPASSTVRTESSRIFGVSCGSPTHQTKQAISSPERMLKSGPATAVMIRSSGLARGSSVPSAAFGIASVASTCGSST